MPALYVCLMCLPYVSGLCITGVQDDGAHARDDVQVPRGHARGGCGRVQGARGGAYVSALYVLISRGSA